MDWKGGVISLPRRNPEETSQLMKYHRNNLSPSSGRGLWRYLAIHLVYVHWLGLSDLMMLSLTRRRWNYSVHHVYGKLSQGAFLLALWQRQRFGLILSCFTAANMCKRTNRWLVYTLLIYIIMHPGSFFQLIHDWSWYMSVCICMCVFVWGLVGVFMEIEHNGALHS